MNIIIVFFILLYGIIIGSFLNVCIYRIPRKESIVSTRSHCMNCAYQLKWYDLVPVLSYLFLRGKCRSCGKQISVQYPVIEVLNGIFYVVVFYENGFNIISILYCLVASALLVLSVIDFRIYEIPDGINCFLGGIAAVRVVLDIRNLSLYLIGFFCVSGFLFLIYFISKGRAIGGGDVKLMAVCGLLLGYKQIIIAFILGCILGSILHLLRMKLSKEDRVLAFGPYLSMGIFLSMLYGEKIANWYLSLFQF